MFLFINERNNQHYLETKIEPRIKIARGRKRRRKNDPESSKWVKCGANW